MALFSKEKKENTGEDIDNYLIESIQPRGGVSFKMEKIINTGSGYEACIRIYELPEEVDDYWLGKVCNIDNVITTLDIHTEDQIEIKKNLNKSIQEQDSRFRSAETHADRTDAGKRLDEMEQLYAEISSMGEIIKAVHFRIFVYDRTLAGLEDKVKNIMVNLDADDYKTAILLNEEKEEWASQWQPYSVQMADKLKMVGLPLQCTALAIGNPFHFSSLSDAYGDYLGDTPCGGNVLFSPFTKTERRTYYNGLVVGEMGSGKSTLLKKLFLSRAIRGDFIRCFDIVGDFTTLTKALGGKVLNLNGSDGMLNPLEILASGDNEGVNFSAAITKATTIYKFLVPDATGDEITIYQNNLRELYSKFDLIPDPYSDKKITGKPANEYPIFSDFLEFVTDKMSALYEKEKDFGELEKGVVQEELIKLDLLRSVLEKIVHNYGGILNGHTTIDNILDVRIITFNIADLKKLDGEVFDAVVFNILSLCWDNCVTNGSIMKSMWENGEIEWEDIIRFTVIIDESHNWINANKLQAVQLVTMYQREARKYFGGLWFASQSIRDYAPEGTGDKSLEKLKDLFEFTQYKFIFRQSSSAIPLISRLFGEQLTDTQSSHIPEQTQGEALLCISGDNIINLQVALSDEEEAMFTGGA